MAASDTVQEPLKSIFVISPIAKLDDDGFDFTKLFLDEIVKPAAAAARGFRVPVRADEVRAPGSITAKVVRDIVNADVCVADLTGRNPNVMYEVAIAHAADKPVILLQQEAGGPPFDFTDERVIRYSTRADEANRARDALKDYLGSARHEDADEQLKLTMHPVRVVFRDLQTRASAGDPEQAILDKLDGVTNAVQTLEALVLDTRVVAERSNRDVMLAKERLMRTSPAMRLTKPRAALLERIEDLARELLDKPSCEQVRDHIHGGHPDYEALEALHMVLRQAESDVRRSPQEQSLALRRATEIVRSLPPF